MKKLLKKEGFTLVELIVVIAILAILAAVAIPAYTGYISKANEAADMSQLDAIKTAVIFVATEKTATADKGPYTVATITVTEGSVAATYEDTDGTTKTIDFGTGKSLVTEVQAYYDIASFEFKSNSTTASWDGSTWELN